MRTRPRTSRRISSALLAALALIAGGTTSSCTNSTSATTLTILTSWPNGAEFAAFQTVVKAFTDKYPGIQVNVEPTRSAAAALQSDVEQNAPPDLAVMPNPSALRMYAQQGKLVQLDKTLPKTLTSDYGPEWYTLMQAWTTHLYAVPVKVDIKSLIWYDPRNLTASSPVTWNDLMALTDSTARTTTPWCLALADPPLSGWPGTDWIEDILLHQTNKDTYNRWVQGKLNWTSNEVTSAWQTWGDIIAKQGRVYGGADGALLTGYGALDDPMFRTPPGCLFSHGALVAYDATKAKPIPGTDYDFFDFPSFGPTRQPIYEVSGDMMGMFRDSPAAEEFLAFMASTEGQVIWPQQQPDVAFSADNAATSQLSSSKATATVPKPPYVNDTVATHIKNRLTDQNATLCFDASDLMPDAMANAFYRAVLEYVQDPSPGNLHTILQNLDTVRAAAYTPASADFPVPVACG